MRPVVKPVVFLDFDGVLNTGTWRADASPRVLQRTGRRVVVALGSEFGMPHDASALLLDPAKVALVNRIVAETGAMVVASTTWRALVDDPCRDLTTILGHAGATFAIEGSTSRSFRTDREDEIERWLRDHGWPPYVVLDDIPMGRLQAVETSDQVGLTPDLAEQAIAILRREVVERRDVSS